MSDESATKEFEPSPRKLEDARRKGEVPIGRDLLTAAAWGGLLVGLTIAPQALPELGVLGMAMLEHPERLPMGRPLARDLGLGIVRAVWPLFVVPPVAVIGALIAQRAIVLAPTRLAPRLSRISPLAGAKRRFGPGGLFDFAKSTTKLIAVSLVLGWFLLHHAPALISATALPAPAIIRLLGQLLGDFLVVIIALQVLIGGIDLLWQHHDHRRRLRMSRQEMMDELKNAEGDPQLKAQRRARATAIANNRMLADVPAADVVIVNPTHYAVALKWDRGRRGAPVCVAKGVDGMALRIREIAMTAGIPLRHDPPTARALHAVVEISAEIPPEHYRTVAAAIRFADAINRANRHRTRS